MPGNSSPSDDKENCATSSKQVKVNGGSSLVQKGVIKTGTLKSPSLSTKTNSSPRLSKKMKIDQQELNASEEQLVLTVWAKPYRTELDSKASSQEAELYTKAPFEWIQSMSGRLKLYMNKDGSRTRLFNELE